MPYITGANDTQLFVKDYGAGRPVVLIHGWPLSADAWESQSVALAEAGYRVIAYDRRGFGRSEQPWSGYDYDTLSDDLRAVITTLDLKDAALIGFSMAGGEIARYMSRHGGEGVVQAALIASVAPFMLQTDEHPEGVPEAVFDGIKASIRADRPAFLAEFFKGFYGQGTEGGGVSEAVLSWSRSVAMMGSLKATLDCVDAFGKTDLRPDMAAFDVPTLVVHGTGDQTVPIDITGRAAAALIKDAELVEYEGAPHGIPATHADMLIDDLTRFLAD